MSFDPIFSLDVFIDKFALQNGVLAFSLSLFLVFGVVSFGFFRGTVDCVEPLVTFVLADLPPLQFALDTSLYAGNGVSLQLAKSILFQSEERKLQQSLSSSPLTVILSDLRYQKQLGFCSIGMTHFVDDLVASPGAASSYHRGVFVFYDQAGAAVASASLYLRMLCVGRSASSSPQLLYALSSKLCIVLPGSYA